MIVAPTSTAYTALGNQAYSRDKWLCVMCGNPLTPRTAKLRYVIPPAHGGQTELANILSICRLCADGINGLSYAPPPSHIHLLSQIRRATIEDQKSVLEWLLRKFRQHAVNDDPGKK